MCITSCYTLCLPTGGTKVINLDALSSICYIFTLNKA